MPSGVLTLKIRQFTLDMLRSLGSLSFITISTGYWGEPLPILIVFWLNI